MHETRDSHDRSFRELPTRASRKARETICSRADEITMARESFAQQFLSNAVLFPFHFFLSDPIHLLGMKATEITALLN